MHRSRLLALTLSLAALLTLAFALAGAQTALADPEPNDGNYVTDVQVAVGSSPNTACPTNYIRRSMDANKGSGGDYVFTCLKFGTDPAQGIEELYVRQNANHDDACAGDDVHVDGDLNSGVYNSILGPLDHFGLLYCTHRPGTYGGSGYIINPGQGSTYFSPDAGKLLHDVQFLYFPLDNPPACVNTACVDLGLGALSYLEYGVTIDPYCQQYFGSSYHPIFHPWEYHESTHDQYAPVPQDSAVFTLNAGSVGSTPYIYACGSYVTPPVPDTTAPTLTFSATTADGRPYTVGTWTNQDVTVVATCADNPGGSGLDVNPAPSTVHDVQNDQVVGGYCADKAGNSVSGTFGPIKIDQTPPTLTMTATTADGRPYAAGAWTNQAVTVAFHCADAGVYQSGLTSNTDGSAALASQGVDQGIPVPFLCMDQAGNVPADSVFRHVNIDLTAPVVTASAATADGQPYTAGAWTNQPVTVTFDCRDAGGAGVESVTGPQSVSGDTFGVGELGGCRDNAGNVAANVGFAPIMIDTTKPTLTASAATADGQPYAAGAWTNQAVTVSFACAEAGGVQSGIAADTVADATLSAEGADQTATSAGDCRDAAGNAADPVSFGPVMLDLTAPRVSVTTPLAATYLLNQPVPVAYACADPLADGATPGAGVASCAGTVADGANLDTGAVGVKTFTVTAADAAGNQAQPVTVSYTVAYAAAQVDQGHGGALALTVQLRDAAGNNVSAAGVGVTALCVVPHGATPPTTYDGALHTINHRFRFETGGPLGALYRYKVDSKGLDKHVQYDLLYTAAGDPTVHVVTFSR